MQLLHMLQLYGPSTPSRLAAWTRLSSGGVTVALDRLEKAGYLRREANPAGPAQPADHALSPPAYANSPACTKERKVRPAACWPRCRRLDLEAVVRFFEAMYLRQDR